MGHFHGHRDLKLHRDLASAIGSRVWETAKRFDPDRWTANESLGARAQSIQRAVRDRRMTRPGTRWVEYVLPDLRRVNVESTLRKPYFGEVDPQFITARAIIKPGGTMFTNDLHTLLMMGFVEVQGDIQDVARTADIVGLRVPDPDTRDRSNPEMQLAKFYSAGRLSVTAHSNLAPVTLHAGVTPRSLTYGLKRLGGLAGRISNRPVRSTKYRKRFKSAADTSGGFTDPSSPWQFGHPTQNPDVKFPQTGELKLLAQDGGSEFQPMHNTAEEPPMKKIKKSLWLRQALKKSLPNPPAKPDESRYRYPFTWPG